MGFSPYFQGLFTYLYIVSILFLLYVFCFLLHEYSCCSGPPAQPTVRNAYFHVSTTGFSKKFLRKSIQPIIFELLFFYLYIKTLFALFLFFQNIKKCFRISQSLFSLMNFIFYHYFTLPLLLRYVYEFYNKYLLGSRLLTTYLP